MSESQVTSHKTETSSQPPLRGGATDGCDNFKAQTEEPECLHSTYSSREALDVDAAKVLANANGAARWVFRGARQWHGWRNAEDLRQDVLVRALKSWHGVPEAQGQFRYVCKIARNKFIDDEMRERRHLQAISQIKELADANPPTEPPSYHGVAEQPWDPEWFRRVMTEFPKEMQVLLFMASGKGKPISNVRTAAHFGIDRRTVYDYRKRVALFLRKHFPEAVVRFRKFLEQ